MKYLTIITLTIILNGCASTKDESVQEDALPTTCNGAAEEIVKDLDAKSIETLKSTKREDLIKFHFSWGMGIRNSFGLWADNSLIRKSCANESGEEDIHPDGASTIIMEKIWDIIKKTT